MYFSNFDKLKFFIATTIPRCIQENFECNLNDRAFQLCITELDDLHYLDFESIEYNMGSFRTLLFEDDDDDSQNSADSQGEVAGAVQNLCVERKEQTKVLPLWTGNPNADLTADLVPNESVRPALVAAMADSERQDGLAETGFDEEGGFEEVGGRQNNFDGVCGGLMEKKSCWYNAQIP
ncbi:hypothetical protein NC651_033487 [Populus alba x Populus x berolinensis]|nr:hypothetical protein NC651_033487 [Populus alba x Populus x berolinensis]